MTVSESNSQLPKVATTSPTIIFGNDKKDILTVAGGCFWGIEHMFRKHYGDKGLVDCKVGYSGGHKSDPDYKKVCSGITGHIECLQVTFDSTKVSYNELIDFFFKIHDPTQADGQGERNIGTQYLSAIFTHDQEQLEAAENIKAGLENSWFKNKIATKIQPIQNWWDAEDYHQNYFVSNEGYHCPTHFLRTTPEK